MKDIVNILYKRMAILSSSEYNSVIDLWDSKEVIVRNSDSRFLAVFPVYPIHPILKHICYLPEMKNTVSYVHAFQSFSRSMSASLVFASHLF